MDSMNFDRLMRAFSEASTRRRFGAALVALGLGAAAAVDPLHLDVADARKRRKRRKKKMDDDLEVGEHT